MQAFNFAVCVTISALFFTPTVAFCQPEFASKSKCARQSGKSPENDVHIRYREKAKEIELLLKRIDSFSVPPTKERFESLCNWKLYRVGTLIPEIYTTHPQRKASYFKNRTLKDPPVAVNLTPLGAFYNGAQVQVWGSNQNKISKEQLEKIFGKPTELSSNVGEFRPDPSFRTLSFKRPYGSITATLRTFANNPNSEEIGSVYFWWKQNLPYETLESFETTRTPLVLLEDAECRLSAGETNKAEYLLRLAFLRSSFERQSGEEKYQFWKRLQKDYVDVYLRRSDYARSALLKNLPCAKLDRYLSHQESYGTSLPTLKSFEKQPWVISHARGTNFYRVSGDDVFVDIYKSSPRFLRCADLFGSPDNNIEIKTKRIPADLFDSEFFDSNPHYN